MLVESLIFCGDERTDEDWADILILHRTAILVEIASHQDAVGAINLTGLAGDRVLNLFEPG